MEKNDNSVDLRQEAHTPLYFKFMARAKIIEKADNPKINFIEVQHYQTKELIPFSHYKPISKIIIPHFEP